MKQDNKDLTSGMAIIYARVSTREQAEDGHSITRQINAGENKAKELGFKLVKVLADEGYSARSLNRPGIQEAVKLIESGFVSAIIIKDLDRLSRDQRNTLAFFSLLEMFKVQLIGTNFDATRENAHQRMVLNIMSAVAQGESEVTGERTIAGIKGGLSKGLYSIPNSPFGYTKHKGKLSINEDEAKIIKEIFYNYGVLDLSTEQVYMIVHPKNKRVTRRQVVYILRDVRYTGIYNYHGEIFDNIIPKIIDTKLFDHVQTKLDTNAKRMKHLYHFNRKLYCNECNSVLRSTSANSKGLHSFITLVQIMIVRVTRKVLVTRRCLRPLKMKL